MLPRNPFEDYLKATIVVGVVVAYLYVLHLLQVGAN